ncbi:MAG: entry exclusion lipoprotein TrbK [Planctomycetes bacterium]|nr:entry exclusion lipoprotein TrbK [Planctomycetota bacterium]
MRTQRFIALILAAALAAGLAGCGKEQPAVASPTCADLDKATDPAQRAELLKKCPRSGPEFKASPKKDY